jgi:hypothetical protein
MGVSGLTIGMSGCTRMVQPGLALPHRLNHLVSVDHSPRRRRPVDVR